MKSIKRWFDKTTIVEYMWFKYKNKIILLKNKMWVPVLYEIIKLFQWGENVGNDLLTELANMFN